ncbi:MAG: right-handed parallel beta-helix repeat-containing protein [Ginsengibacter sp.]
MRTFLSIVAVCLCSYVNATNYYFSSVSGNDSRSTLQAANPATPWKTLSKLNSFMSSLKFGDSVLLKRGETFDGGIIITISGSTTSPVVFGAYGAGAKPVINGFTTLSKWNSIGNGIYECGSSSLGATVNMVTINGQQQGQGRFPNTTVNKGYLIFESHGANSIIDNQLTSSTDWTGAEVVIKPKRWILDRCVISSHKGSTISYSPSLTYTPYDNYGYFIQNHIKTLDLPGEWFYNSSLKKMDVFSQPVNFNASIVDVLVSVSSQNNIVFDNIVFTGSNSRAIDLYNAQNITIKNCDFLFSGIDGVFGSSTKKLILLNNSFANTNNNAINLGYNCNNSIVKNNIIKSTGLIAGMGLSGNNTYQAITVNGQNNLVEYNNIDSTGFTAIRFGSGDSNIIKNNFITNFTITKDDGGGINTIGTSGIPFKGIKVIGNIIKNGIGISEGTDKPGTSSSNGIYMDDNTSNVLIDGNTVLNCGKSGIFFHNAFSITLNNNTIFDNGTQLIMVHDYAMPNALLRNNIINKDIFFSKLTTQVATNVSTMADDINMLGVMDSNYYCRPLDDNLVTKASYINTAGTRIDQIFDLGGWQAAYKLDKASKKTPIQIPAYVTTTASANKFANGTFNSGNTGLYSSSTGTWVSNKLDGGTFKATNTSLTNSYYQVIIGVGAIDATKNYLLKFSAQSMKDTVMSVYLRMSGSPYTRLSDTKVFKITTGRTENEFLFSLPAAAASASLIIETRCPQITFWLDNVELYEANSTITDPDKYIMLQYNASQVPKTILLQGTYVDVKNKLYSNSVVLAPYSSIILINQNAPLKSLPLSFLDFNGAVKNKSIDLQWETTNESNTDRFEVERASADFNYSKLGTVKATNAQGILHYNFTDFTPGKSINYYRLKQFDIDGKFTYSKVIHFQNSSNFGLTISPNPVKNKINLQVNGLQNSQDISYYIFSASGSLVKIGHENSVNSVVNIDVSNLNGGMYSIKAILGDVSISKEFMKL